MEVIEQAEKVPAQEKEGLLSPWLRSRRFAAAARHLQTARNVLDLGSGTGALSERLPAESRYVGIDWSSGTPIAQVEANVPHRVVVRGDVARPDAALQEFLRARAPFDALVALAFIEHVTDPAAILSPYVGLLSRGGLVVLTTPHPVGRSVHDWLARAGVCSRGAAEEHESFLGRPEISGIAVQLGRSLKVYQRFLLGLNQVAVLG